MIQSNQHYSKKSSRILPIHVMFFLNQEETKKMKENSITVQIDMLVIVESSMGPTAK